MPHAQARLTVLGSGTFVPNGERASAAYFLEAGDARILLDCGSGTLHGLARHNVVWQSVTHVVLTHFHNDHVGDLGGLLVALRLGVRPPREAPLTLVGPPGLADFLRRLEAVVGSRILEPGFPLEIREQVPGRPFEDPSGAFRLESVSTPHTTESVAYRWEGAGGTLGYTGDTGPSEAVARLLTGVDVLVAECTQEDPPTLDTHLSPRGVAALAGVAQPGLLVLTHVASPLDPQEAARQVRGAGYTGRVVAAYDGLRIPLEP